MLNDEDTPGFTSIITSCPGWSSWVWPVATVTVFLETVPVTTLKLVFRLCWTPVPIPRKAKVVEVVVVPTPTNVPVVPNPTLTVESPIKLLDTFAINNCVPLARVVPTPTFVSSWTTIPEPIPEE